jgi:oligosaccharyltransferase complex subunit alpha (ribophorin I)
VLETVQSGATHPWPRAAAQGDPQLLRFEAALFVPSPYATVVQRTKIRCGPPPCARAAR